MGDRAVYPVFDEAEREYLIRTAQSTLPSAAEAETELVRRYLPLVRSLVRPLYLWGWETEDFLQEGTLGLIKAIRTYDADKSPYFGVYAKTCIINQMRKVLESNLRKKDIPAEGMTSLDQGGIDYEDRTLPEMDEAIISKDEERQLVDAILAVCSGLERKILEAYLGGLSYDEMAVSLKVSKRSIQNAMYRIRNKSERIQKAHNQA